MIPTLLGVVLLIFFLFEWFGGDPAEIIAGQGSTQVQVDVIRTQLGLDLPAWKRLLRFVGQILQFDWGKSWATNEAVSHIFETREVLLAVPAAMAVAYVRGSLTDRFIMVLITVALSISFLVYIIVGQWLFAFQLAMFPVQGWGRTVLGNLMTYAPLPVLLAVLVGLAPQTRLYRSFFLDEIGQDYVRTARAKGLSEFTILRKHVLRNALIPVLTNIAVQLPGVLVGSFLIEVFFSIPGLGREILLAVNRSDYPVIQAVTVYLAMFTMVINLMADLMYKLVDPRVVLK
jgi:peptide/nickel transport system permease protein